MLLLQVQIANTYCLFLHSPILIMYTSNNYMLSNSYNASISNVVSQHSLPNATRCTKNAMRTNISIETCLQFVYALLRRIQYVVKITHTVALQLYVTLLIVTVCPTGLP